MQATKLNLMLGIVFVSSVLLFGCERESIEAQTDEAGMTVTTEDGSGDDLNITTAVHTALRAEQRLQHLNIQVETNKGDVRLHGDVETQAQRELAENIVKGTAGVHAVNNELKVKNISRE